MAHIYPDTHSEQEVHNAIWTLPNCISFLRILSIPIIAVFVAHHQLVYALLLFAISAASDGVDGYIARRFNQISTIGQMLDPIADRLLIFCSMLVLATTHVIPLWLFVIVVLRDVMLSIEILVLAQHGYGPLPVHFVGKSGTALLLVSLPLLIMSDMGSQPVYGWLQIIGLAFAIWGLGLYWVAGLVYLWQGKKILAKENSHHTRKV